MTTESWLAVCLCADWCGVCKQYRPAFEALAAELAQSSSTSPMRLIWLDVEDEEDALGDLDVATFPTVLVGRGAQAVFLGPLLPQIAVLGRMLESFRSGGVRPLPPGDEAHALLARVQALTAARAG